MVSRKLFTIFYAIATLSCLVLLTTVTVNYLQFFPALESIQVAPERQQVIIDPQTNMTQVLLDLRVFNPSGYSGLKVQYVGITLNVTTINFSLFKDNTLFSPNIINAPLGPRNAIRIRALFLLTQDQSKIFVPFYDKYGPIAIYHYDIDVHLITFLEASTGIDVFRDIQYPLQ